MVTVQFSRQEKASMSRRAGLGDAASAARCLAGGPALSFGGSEIPVEIRRNSGRGLKICDRPYGRV